MKGKKKRGKITMDLKLINYFYMLLQTHFYLFSLSNINIK